MTVIKLCLWLADVWDELWDTGQVREQLRGLKTIWQRMREEMCFVLQDLAYFLKNTLRGLCIIARWILCGLWGLKTSCSVNCLTSLLWWTWERENQAVNGLWVVGGGGWKSLDAFCIQSVWNSSYAMRYTSAVWCSERCGCPTQWKNWKTPPFEIICSEQCLSMRLYAPERNLTAVSNGYTIYCDED